MMSWFEMSLLEILLLQVPKHQNKLSRRDKGLRAGSNGAFLFLYIFRIICSLPLQHHFWEGWHPPLRVAWVHECAFTRHVNNWRQLLHFGADRERGRLWGKVSQYDLNRSFLCSLSFSLTKRSRPFIISQCFHLFCWKVLVRGDFDWAWQLDLVAQFCCGFFSWQFPTDKCILSLLMSLKKGVPVQWQFSFFSVPLFFVCLLFIALSWEKSCEISCQLGVNFLCSVIAAVLKPCVYSFYIPCIVLFPKVIFNLDWTWI